MAARTQVTLAQFRTQVYYRLGNTVFWSSSEVTGLINAALRTWNCMTGYWHGRQLITTVAGTPYYQLASSLVFGAHVEFNGVNMSQGSVFGWDQADPYWESSRGTPVEWSPVGIAILAIRPVDQIGRNTLLVDGLAVTPVLVADGDFIDLGQEDFEAITGYIQHLATFKCGGLEFQSTMPLYKDFIEAAGVKCEKFRASALYRRVMGLDEDKSLKPWRARGALNPVGVR